MPDRHSPDPVSYTHLDVYKRQGAYRLITTLGSAETEQDITLSATELSAPDVVLNAAKVMLHPKGTPDGPVEDNASLNFKACLLYTSRCV